MDEQEREPKAPGVGSPTPPTVQVPPPYSPPGAYGPADPAGLPTPPAPAHTYSPYQPVAAPKGVSNPQATASLVLGIVSLLLSLLFVPALIGVVLGIVGLVRAGRTDPPVGRGAASAGLVLSVAGAVLGVFLALNLTSFVSDIGDRIAQESGPAATADEAVPFDPDDFVEVGQKQWASIVRHPDQATGRAVVVYAEVQHFDSTTGDDRFLAGASVDQPGSEYEVQVNALFVGDRARLDGVRAGDVLRIHAVVTGEVVLETELGGTSTVPVLEIARLKDVGLADLSDEVAFGTPVDHGNRWVSLPVTVTNSGSATYAYGFDVVAESADGSTTYSTGTGGSEKLKPGQEAETTVEFFDDIPADAVYRATTVERYTD